MVIEEINNAFHPRSIAVAGASNNHMSMGYNFLRYLVDYGFRGEIYPINHKQRKIMGLKAYSSLPEVPGPVDYVICCLPASNVLNLLDQCSNKKVKAIQLFTARLGETGDKDATLLEKQILKKAKGYGIRLIGPNCMGIYYPGMRISFGYDLPREPGSVGMFFQSGGVSAGFIRYASLQGIRFSKVVSYGNGLDLNESDFLDYFSQDPETKIIVSYLEGLKDGRKFFDVLCRASTLKPVIILKGGKSDTGGRAAASHTASLAGSIPIFEKGIKQAGAVQALTLEEMVDLTASFYYLPPITGRNIGIIGVSGGRGVLSADEFELEGFNLIPLPPKIRKAIKETVSELWWNWIGNPIDISMLPKFDLRKDLLELMTKDANFDLIVVNLEPDAPLEKKELVDLFREEVDEVIEIRNSTTKPIAAILHIGSLGIDDFENWRWRLIAEQKTRLIAARIPVYASISQAARALSRFIEYYRRKESK